MLDTHCHLDFNVYNNRRDEVVSEANTAGVHTIINIGVDRKSSVHSVELADTYDSVYAAVGVHPRDAKTLTDEVFQEIRELAHREKVVAIGETGLDYHYNLSLHEEQTRVFAAHLKIASALNLPVIVHCRNAFNETMEILESHGSGVKRVVFHCFSGSAEQAKIVLDRGYYISFTGVVTFKNARIKQQAAKIVPLDRLMLETDCPYMSPEPMRKQKVNEPALLIHTAKFLTELKQMPMEEFAQQVNMTTKNFFNIP